MNRKNQLSRHIKIILGTILLVLGSYSVHAQCNFELSQNVTDLDVNLEVYNTTDFGPYHPQVVEWLIDGESVGMDAVLNHSFTSYGGYEVCVDFEVNLPDGSNCADQICESIVLADSTGCQAFFEYGLYDGDLPNVGGISFSNLSVGNYTNVSWDFGDGNYYSNLADSVTHFYENDGLYDVCLTIWDATNCQSVYCQQVSVFIADSACYQSDCVFPGDANYDGEANLIDLLNIGYGLGENGPMRPNASNDWVGQMAPDWPSTTPYGINYKHLDCDGNGTISAADLVPVMENYTAMHDGVTSVEGDAPLVYIEFDADSIIIDENSPDQILVTANLVLGTEEIPAEDFSGIALYMDYDTQYVVENSVTVNYENESFFGDANNNEVLWMPNDLYEKGQVDMGFSRVNGSTVDGHGVIARVSFIISEDIIGGRAERELEIPLSLNVVGAFNGAGSKVDLSTTEIPATILVVDITTGIVNPELSKKIKVFPNPASKELNIDLGDLNGNYIEMYNALGQLVLTKEMEGNKDQVVVNGLAKGLYFVNIHTDKGIANKRVIIN